MRHLDLFSGIGGFALAASWVWGDEHEVVAFCEKDEYCRKVLKKHWPDVPILEDVRNVRNGFGEIGLCTGGFPCQPFSTAGNKRGTADDRYLWPEMSGVIEKTEPNWVLIENVTDIDDMLVLDKIIFDMESIGYEVAQPLEIPACAIGADHRRFRTWVVCHSNNNRKPICTINDETLIMPTPEEPLSPNTNCERRKGCISSEQFFSCTQKTFSQFGNRGIDQWNKLQKHRSDLRIGNGLSVGMVRHMVRGLGNAIVPQVAEQIFRAMKAADDPRTP